MSIYYKLKKFLKHHGYTVQSLRKKDYFYLIADYESYEFKIKELPDWRFGLWVNYDYSDFFCQYEDNIDKFKPTRSALCCQVKYTWFPCALDLVDFVKNNPELAFWVDNTYNFKWLYSDFTDGAKEKAIKYFNDYKQNKAIETEKTVYWNKQVLDFVIDHLAKDGDIEDCFIVYRQNIFPNYDIIAQCDVEVPGPYTVFDGDTSNEFYELLNTIKKEAKELGIYYWTPIDNVAYMCNRKTFKKRLNRYPRKSIYYRKGKLYV